MILSIHGLNLNFIICFSIRKWKSKLENLINETHREWTEINEMVNQASVIDVSISCKRIVFWELEILMENYKRNCKMENVPIYDLMEFLEQEQTYKNISMVL